MAHGDGVSPLSIFDEAIAAGFANAVHRAADTVVEASLDIEEREDFDAKMHAAALAAVNRWAEDHLGQTPELRYRDEFEFFDDYLRMAYQVSGASQDRGWCGRWWGHPSALFRVRAMWQAYEVRARSSPADCDEYFLRYIGDHHMRFLLGEQSPMRACQTDHQASRELASEPIDKET